MLFIVLIILIFLIMIRWQSAVEMSPFPVQPHIRNMVLDGQIYLNPVTWDKEVLVHEMAHVVRGKGPRDGKYDDPDHDPEFWKTYDSLLDRYGVPRK